MKKIPSAERIRRAEVVLPCEDLDATLRFFIDALGFRLDSIFPADSPAVASLSGYGLSIRLQVGADAPPGRLRVATAHIDADQEQVMTAPNGTRIEFVAESAIALPVEAQSFVLHKLGDGSDWGTGRAGMQYRDLIPGRQGGRFIASHIRIPQGGAVPDLVHYHKIRVQMIYCYKGWVRLVYEDQGEPFVMHAGDCVLQPPEIRHRVLECGAGLEVVEIGCPAEHMTCIDHDLTLPTNRIAPERDFGGQRFVHHVAASAAWQPWRLRGFEARDLGIAAATDGLAGARVARAIDLAQPAATTCHSGEFLFLFVLEGELSLQADGHGTHTLGASDACTIPAGMKYAVAAEAERTEILEVALPPEPH